MKFVVLFEDADGVDPDIRTKHMPDHLAFLEAHAGVETAGPLSDATGAAHGGLWIVEAADETEVQALVETDPFWPTGLRRSVRILRWRQVYAAGARQV